MRSKALSFLLSLSLMYCVGFGSSITASAYTGLDGYYNSFPLVTVDNNQALRLVVYSPSGNFSQTVAPFSPNEYLFSNSSFSDVTQIRIGTSNVHFDVLFNYNNFDYYFYCTFSCNSELNFDFIPSRVVVRTYDNQFGSSSGSIAYDLEDLQIYYTNDTTKRGFSIVGKLPDSINNTCIDVLDVYGSGSIDSNLYVSGAVFAFEKKSSSSTAAIISAINNQTSQLGGKIDGAADDIQQSIEDQYGGNPGSSFPVDDIITQHNEKMGVLSFSSDALMQVLGLLSPDQNLSSELVFPSMSLTIAGQRNKVQLWPEYRFDLNTLKQHWPDFVGLMQSLTTALVWIFVLRYCYRVFEKYFLAGGGS